MPFGRNVFDFHMLHQISGFILQSYSVDVVLRFIALGPPWPRSRPRDRAPDAFS